jgi:hypothetical protein
MRDRFGWSPAPRVNLSRLKQLKLFLGKPRLASPIQKMLREDDLFRKSDSALDSYALAWGVTYFLVKRKPKELAAYLKILQEKTPDSEDNAEIRLQDFESCFGDHWTQFYREFYDFVRRL